VVSFLQFFEGEAVMILLASVSSGILAMWPNRERRRAWTIADRRGCPVYPSHLGIYALRYMLSPVRLSVRQTGGS